MDSKLRMTSKASSIISIAWFKETRRSKFYQVGRVVSKQLLFGHVKVKQMLLKLPKVEG
jgi:hypothetical protein